MDANRVRCRKWGDMIGFKHSTTKEAKGMGEKLGADWSNHDVEQLRMGEDVELEHGKRSLATYVTGDDPTLTARIALAHLDEFPDHNTRLDKLEKEAEQALKKMKKI